MPVLAPVITTTLPSIRALLSTLVIDQETIIENRNLPPLSPASESRPRQCCHKCHHCPTGQTHRRLKRRWFCFQEEVELVFTFISWGCVACTLRFVLNTDIFLQYFTNFDWNQLVCNVRYVCSMYKLKELGIKNKCELSLLLKSVQFGWKSWPLLNAM